MLVERKTTEGVGTEKPHVTSGAMKSVDRREVRNPASSVSGCAEFSFPMH